MLIKRRLIFWIIKAYVKRWGKFIFLSFITGLAFFFLLETVLFNSIKQITIQKTEIIGVVGAYTVNTLPDSILSHVSRGLTKVDQNGTVSPDLASGWKILDNGQTYEVFLKKGEHFSDGTPFASSTITYSFTNVKIDRPNAYTLIFHLKDAYAPFLVTLSRLIFRNGFIGLGDYRVQHITFNGNFIENITITTSNKNHSNLIYQFYPTEDALKIAFSLGEVSLAKGLSSLAFQQTSFLHFKNMTTVRTTDYGKMVALFYNTQDKTLSDKRIRDALSYALPNTFTDGERAWGPLPPSSWAYQVTNQHTRDFTHTKLLFQAVFARTTPAIPTLTITTSDKYIPLAKIVQQSWKNVGVTTNIEVIQGVPTTFQMYLGDYSLPNDPDQYTLWHSLQNNNITHFSSQRIDKLLEEGRKTIDQHARLQIYQDFQKYLDDEQPATFLYFPYSYTITRK